jgi:hypothetical protein
MDKNPGMVIGSGVNLATKIIDGRPDGEKI